jgi:hypothetical protein
MNSNLFLTIILVALFARETNAQRQQSNYSSNRGTVKPLQQETNSKDSVSNGKWIEPELTYPQQKKVNPITTTIVDSDSSTNKTNDETICYFIEVEITHAKRFIADAKRKIDYLNKELAKLEDLVYKLKSLKDSSSGNGLTSVYQNIVSAIEDSLDLHEKSPSPADVSIGIYIGYLMTEIDFKKKLISVYIKNLITMLAKQSELEKEKKINCDPRQKMNSGEGIKNRIQ